MDILITEAAGYFLKAQMNIQYLLYILEWQDFKAIDFMAIKQLSKSALLNIIQSRSNIEELIGIAEVKPYDLEVIGQLSLFDYENLLKAYRLNPFIFGIVKDYLVKGDITGTYRNFYRNLCDIEQLLLNIQSSMTENRIPELSILWSINEKCAETALFGSYIARIFKEIR